MQPREAARLSQDDVIKRLGEGNQPNVSRWEKGRAVPDLKTVVALSELYGVGLSDLVVGGTGVPDTISPAVIEGALDQMQSVIDGLRVRATRSAAAEQSAHATDSQLLVEAAEEAARGKPPRNKAGG